MNNQEILEILRKTKFFKNYKVMCKALGWKVSSGGSSKKAQFKDLDCYCKYEKQGQKIIILEVFDEPRERECRNQKRDAKYEELNDILYYNFIDRIKRADTKEVMLRIDVNDIITHSFLDNMNLLFDNSNICKKNINKSFSKKHLIGCISTAFKHCSYINEKSVGVHIALMLDRKDLATDKYVIVRLNKKQEEVYKDFDKNLLNLLGYENINTRTNIIKEKLNIKKKINYFELTINVNEFLAYQPKMSLEEATNSVFERKFETFLEIRKETEEISQIYEYNNLKEVYRPVTKQYSMIESLYLEDSSYHKAIDNLEDNCKRVLEETKEEIKAKVDIVKS